MNGADASAIEGRSDSEPLGGAEPEDAPTSRMCLLPNGNEHTTVLILAKGITNTGASGPLSAVAFCPGGTSLPTAHYC